MNFDEFRDALRAAAARLRSVRWETDGAERLALDAKIEVFEDIARMVDDCLCEKGGGT